MKRNVIRPASRYDDAAKVVESIVWSSGPATILPATSVRLLLHHGGRDGRRRTSHPHTCAWIDYRNRISRAEG